MTARPYVELQGVTRRWNGQGGVEDVSLQVERGAFVSILGPSGCGKSTLLRLISGLERPERGAVRIDGDDVTALQASRRGLSMVFQSYALFPHLSVQENILFGMRVRRAPRAERARRLAEAAAMLGLEGLEARKPSALSGGQRQRVALARAVVSGHPLCLMDEPLSNLDAKLRHAVRRDIKGLQRRLGLTVIYVTHDQTEAMSLSDRIVLMRDARVEQIGAPAELYAAPATTFAAEFVGDPPMALVEGEALGAPGLRVGIRPEHVEIAGEGEADLTARTREIEYLGAHTHVLADHPAARGLIVTVPGRADIRPGETIGLRLPRRRWTCFDARTGRASDHPDPDREERPAPALPASADRRPDPC